MYLQCYPCAIVQQEKMDHCWERHIPVTYYCPWGLLGTRVVPGSLALENHLERNNRWFNYSKYCLITNTFWQPKGMSEISLCFVLYIILKQSIHRYNILHVIDAALGKLYFTRSQLSFHLVLLHFIHFWLKLILF